MRLDYHHLSLLWDLLVTASAAFVAVERRVQQRPGQPMLDLSLFRYPRFVVRPRTSYVTGARQVKFSQTYTAGRPST